ncbi:hypothetical protein Cantr_06934 [Candida viswanathii]|uniref:Uncharacterized protein n=1 Tax=Candida viswanathii TaxID=5486 RepID=A0A367XXR5_9ASCO|nr:hypothetical protein Cantr_06934 [Candida viswanathii]
MTTSYVVLSDDEDGVALPPPPPVLPPLQKSSQPELTDTDEDIPSTGMAMTSATATFRQTSTTSVSNNLTSFKPASRKSSMLPPEEEIIVVDSDGEDSEDMKDSTDVKDLFNLVQDFVTKPIASSPVKVASQKNDDTLNDSIVDSSFHFLVDGAYLRGDPLLLLHTCNRRHSQPAPSTTILAQPVKRSKSTQNPPDDKPAKRAKRSKTTDIITHLPKIDDYQYTQQDLKNANRVTRKKEEIYEEMKLHVSSAVYSLFANDMTNFKMELVQTDYELPIMFWKRNITAMYDKERDIFIPCHQQKLMEKTLVMYYLGPEFLRS